MEDKTEPDATTTGTGHLVPVEFTVETNSDGFVVYRSEGTDKTGFRQVREDWMSPTEAIDIAHELHSKADELLTGKRT